MNRGEYERIFANALQVTERNRSVSKRSGRKLVLVAGAFAKLIDHSIDVRQPI